MKYYLYISDTKLDMLYSQVPHDSKEKTALELGFDLKVAKGSIKTEKESEENRYTKLDCVLDYLEESDAIGTIEEPREYARGEMEMRYAPWGSRGSFQGFGNVVQPDQAVFVCFGGQTETTHVVLWGSWKHVLGESNESTTGHFPYSTTSLATLAMWDYFDSLLVSPNAERSKIDTGDEEAFAFMHKLKKRADDYRGIRANAFQVYSPEFPSEKIPYVLAFMVNGELKGPHQRMEFVARDVKHYSADGRIRKPSASSSTHLSDDVLPLLNRLSGEKTRVSFVVRPTEPLEPECAHRLPRRVHFFQFAVCYVLLC